MQVEGSRNHREDGDGRSHPPAGINSAKDEYSELHGVFEGEECDDDL